MKFTPFGIQNQEFNKSVRGYDRDEVKAFLEKLADEYERMQNENEKLKQQVEYTEEQLKEYRKIEKNLQSAMLNAAESTSKAVDSAKKQSALMIKEAELKAAQTLEKAKERADLIRDSVLKLREEKKLLISRIKSLIDTQAQILEFHVENDSSKKMKEYEKRQINKQEDQSEINVNDILEKLL